MKLNPKYRRRVALVGLNSLHTLIMPVINIIISFLVIKIKNVELWGEFVYFIIIINLINHIVGWGQKEYLLRDFSTNPTAIAKAWQKSVINRFPLLMVSLIIIILLGYSIEIQLILGLWLFSLYMYKSYDVLVIYKRKFSFIIKVEIFNFVLLVALLFLSGEHLNTTLLLSIFAGSSLLKTMAVVYHFHGEVFLRYYGKFDPTYLRMSFPLFIPGFLGLIQTRTDLYCVAYYLSKKEVGEYQILINLLFYWQSVASLLITPFIKNIYRLSDLSLRHMMFSLFRVGVIFSIPAIFLIYFILFYYYRFEFSVDIYIISYFYVIPFYLYLVKLYQLFKHNRQISVVYITIFATAINLILNIFLIKIFGLKGALFSSAISQWVVLLLFFNIKSFPKE